MPVRLLRFTADDQPRWVERDDVGRVGVVREGWPTPEPGVRLWLVMPAEQVLLLSVARPPGSVQQMERALPFAIEDRLAAAIESQHVAWAPASVAGQVDVAVADRARVRAWVQRLAEHGLVAEALVPEPVLLPWSPGRASLLVEQGRALLRYGPMQAFCGRAEEVQSLPLARPETIDRILPERALSQMAEGLSTARPPLNLLQGEFEPVRRAGAVAAGWRWAAIAVSAGLLLAVLFALAERMRLAATVAEQREEMATLYRSAVPGAGRVVDAEQQLRSALGGAVAGDVALRLLARAAPVLAAMPGLHLDVLEFRAGQMEWRVLAPDVAVLDDLRARLRAAGIAAELTAATAGTRGVEGRLTLRATP